MTSRTPLPLIALITLTAEVYTKKTRKTTREIRHYIASPLPQTHTRQKWAAIIRGHWAGVESRNPYKRDGLLREDKIRSRHPNICGSLALLCHAAHFLITTAAPPPP